MGVLEGGVSLLLVTLGFFFEAAFSCLFLMVAPGCFKFMWYLCSLLASESDILVWCICINLSILLAISLFHSSSASVAFLRIDN